MTTLRLACSWGVAGLALVAAAYGSAQEVAGEQSLTLQLLVPADAVVEIDGNPTTSPGELRRYVTPPLRTGKEYSYTLKVTSGGKSVSRQVHVSHAADNTFDLRDDFRAAGTPAAGNPAPAAGPRATDRKEVVGKSLSVKGMLLHRTDHSKEWWKGVWEPVDDKADLSSEDLLVGVPLGAGLQSKNGAVHLSFLTDFGSPLPVLEPAVVLHANPDVDLDFTLDRGRVDVTNTKEQGPARVRIRSWGATWDATLSAPKTRLAVEVLGRWPAGSRFSPKPGARDVPSANLIFLAISGEVDLRYQGNHHLLTAPPGPAQIGWDNFAGMDPTPQRLEMPPAWALPDKDEKAHQLRQQLAQAFAGRPVGEVLDEMAESDDPVRRKMGVVFMGATDDLERLARALHQEKHRDVWDNAVLVMRRWLGRAPGQDQRFYKGLLEVRKYTPVQAQTLIEFLHGFSETDRERPETYEMLIDYLADERVSIRGLAHWHLIRLVPEGKKIPYDPMGPKEAREKARQEWKKLIPPGKLPPEEKGSK
jgi:uncharacterized protein (TIGR03000 family)